jgi:putative hydrolase of the HAD superfamily
MLAAPSPPGIQSSFAHVDTWIFDLDNTLYPSSSDLWPKIDRQITLFLAELFGIDGLSSRALQKFYYQRYGTSLKGLMLDYGIDPQDFLEFAHDIDRSTLAPDPALSAHISRLPGRKLIYTNGSEGHAIATAQQLGILQHFSGIFDIVAADYVPKPDPLPYARFFARFGVEPARAAMFEDLEKNLLVPHQSGMKTVLVVAKRGATDHREAWEQVAAAPAHVDFVTDDLASFLGLLDPQI